MSASDGLATPRSAADSLPVRIVRSLVPLLIVGLGIFGAFALYGLRATPQPKEIVELPPLVKTVALASHTSGLTIEIDGLVVPHREVLISAEIPGRIIAKDGIVKPGNFVSKGQRLLTIDPRDFELDKERLSKEYRQAETILSEMEVELANATELKELAAEDLELQRREVKRLEKLSKVISESEFDQAKRAEVAARNTEAQFRNQIRMIETKRARLESGKELVAAQLEKAERDLGRTSIEAPIDGVIIKEMVEQDSFVQKGTALVTIEDTSAVEVRCQLRMEELYWLWRQQAADPTTNTDPASQRDYQIPQTPATIIYQIGRERFAWQGVLSRFDGIGLDEKTRTMPCRVLVPNPRDVRCLDRQTSAAPIAGPPALVRGMYVSVKLHTKPQCALWRVPEAALRPGNSLGDRDTQSLSAIWVVRKSPDAKQDLLKVVPVEVAGMEGSDVVLHVADDQLQTGEQVVITPLAEARPDLPIRLEAVNATAVTTDPTPSSTAAKD